MIVDFKSSKYLQDFNQYAKFISNHFGISVEFDGTEAHTDGKVIRLPNILGMSKEEVDYLYCILLHEAGHIIHSDFTKEAFAMLKTRGHAHLANAIEDARIENLLMKDFDGAHDIFDKLYGQYVLDKDLTNKVFGVDMKNCSVFHALGIYLHQYIVNLKNKQPLNKVIPKKVLNSVLIFIQSEDIDSLVKNTPLNQWTDVVELTNNIYAKFVKHFTDNTDKNNIEIQDKTVDAAQDQMLAVGNEIQESFDSIKQMQDEIKKHKNTIKEIKTLKQKEISELQAKASQLENRLNKVDQTLQDRADEERLKNKLRKHQELKSDVVAKSDQYKVRKDELQAALDAANQPTESDSTENKIKPKSQEKLNKQKEYLTSRVQKLEQKQKELTEKEKTVAESLAETKASLGKNKDLEMVHTEDLKKESADTQKDLSSIYEKLNELNASSELETVVAELTKKAAAMKSNIESKLTGTLKDLQEQMNKAGIPVELIPSFQESAGWPEGDEVQKEWDEKASMAKNTLVANGAGMDLSGIRNILMEIEKANDKLHSIDLSKHFKSENKMSKFESFNEIVSQINNTDAKENGTTFQSFRKHIPVSTKFDTTVKLTQSNKTTKLDKIKTKHAVLIQKVKQELKNKIKVSKKDYFRGSQEEGQLDARNLWKLAAKTDETYYEVNRPKKINKVTASIAIDVSGSMDKDVSEHGEKLRELSALLSEGLSEAYIRHEIVGYHAPVNLQLRSLGASGAFNRRSNSLETVVYRGFNDKGYRGLENMEIKSTDNSDGESLRAIGKRIIKESSKQKIMFIITDGKPFLSDANIAVMDQDLKDSLVYLKSQKVKVFALGFNEKPKEFYGEDYFQIKQIEDVLTFIKKRL